MTFIKMLSTGEATKYSMATAGLMSGQLLNCEELVNAAPALQIKRWKMLQIFTYVIPVRRNKFNFHFPPHF